MPLRGTSLLSLTQRPWNPGCRALSKICPNKAVPSGGGLRPARRYVYLVDCRGRVRWQACGRARGDEAFLLLDAAEALLGGA